MKQNETEIEHENESVPFVVHESDMARDDIKNRRLWMTINGLAAVIAGAAIYGVIKICQNRNS